MGCNSFLVPVDLQVKSVAFFVNQSKLRDILLLVFLDGLELQDSWRLHVNYFLQGYVWVLLVDIDRDHLVTRVGTANV